MRKKVASVLLTVCLLATLSPHVSAKEPTFSDTSGHWAETQIEAWANRGIIQGSDGAFRPNAYITRGAVAAIIDRILKYPTADANTFLDLPDNSYFTESVLKLSHAGVMLGYTDRTARPNASVTRQEVVVLLARAFHVEESPDTVLTYADKADISPFAVNAVKAFSALGYVHGDQSNLFRPKDPITRAEFVTIIHNMIAELSPVDQQPSDASARMLVINQPEVTIKDRTAKAVFIAPGAGEGNVTLDNVTTENLYVLGGGTHSIIIEGKSNIQSIQIAKQDSGVRVMVSKGAAVEVTQILDGCDDVILSGSFHTIAIDSSKNTIQLADATINSLAISGSGTNVVVGENTKVSTLAIAESANQATVEVKGKIGSVQVDNDSAKVTTSGSGSTGGGSSGGSSSGGSATGGGSTGGEDTPDKPVTNIFGLTIIVSGGGSVYAEEIETPVEPKPEPEPEPEPPVIDPIDPEVDGYPLIIQAGGHGLAIAEEAVEPDTPEPEPEPEPPQDYIVRIQVSGQGTVVIQEIGE